MFQPYKFEIEYEYLPDNKRILSLKQELAENFNVTYYLNSKLKIDYLMEKSVVLTSSQ